MSYSSHSQMGKVTGKVEEEKGEVVLWLPLSIVKMSQLAQTTDENDNFLLELPTGKLRLICRFSECLRILFLFFD